MPRLPALIPARTLPLAVLCVAIGVAVWREQGSIAAHDWLPVAVLAALAVATVAASGSALRPHRAVVVGAGALVGLAAWTAVSIAWSPTPAGARDEALLTLLYALALILPSLTLPGAREQESAAATIVALLAAVGALAALELALSGSPARLFFGGRLDFPITYTNACSAFFVLGFWPAVVLASCRHAPPALRAGALGCGALLLALAIAAQSKGTIVGLAISALLVFGLAPSRLRLLPALLIAVAPAAAAAVPLTGPFRSAAAGADHRVGWAALAVLGAGLALGSAYVWVDRRRSMSEASTRLATRLLLGLVVSVAVTATTAFLATHDPATWLGQKWSSFKRPAAQATGSTHLTSLGSNRYDFWRVALDEARAHPLRGVGGRGFYSAYLRQRRSGETPLRAHSLYLDVLAEEGVPGLALLLVGIGAPFVLLLRRLARPSGVAALGATVYFFTHAAVDWIWTVPVVGLVSFLIVGVGCAGEPARRLSRTAAATGALAGLAVALFAFAPPWIAFQYVTAAYRAANPSVDLRRARALDPLSLEPYFAEWRLAPTASGQVAALEAARRVEPASVAVLYQLGLAYLREGRRTAALTTLRRAASLDPRDATVRAAVRLASH